MALATSKGLFMMVLVSTPALADTDAKEEAMNAMLSVESGDVETMKAIMEKLLAKNPKPGCYEVVVKEANATVTNKICITK